MLRRFALAAFLVLAGVTPALSVRPHASHVTVIVMENRDAWRVVHNASAPYFNRVLVPQGMLFTNAHAIEHPSQPNYLDLFSGSNQGVTSDGCPVTFSAPNIASALHAAGKRFIGFAESLPRVGYRGCQFRFLYARKHAPWVDFSNVPASDSRPYVGGVPAPMPDLAWIIPNMCNDMHDCATHTGDAWLRAHLPSLIAWNAAHDGLLIITWDEADPDLQRSNRIPTLFIGPMVRPGTSSQYVNHFTVLRTIEAIFGVGCIARECTSDVITDIWR